MATGNLQRRASRALVAALVALASAASPTAQAGQSTITECVEGSDFIEHAADARDNGMSRAAFLGRLDADFQTIRAFPVALRWFVKDRDDETFLRGAAADVYDRPLAPEKHRELFFAACVSRAAA